MDELTHSFAGFLRIICSIHLNSDLKHLNIKLSKPNSFANQNSLIENFVQKHVLKITFKKPVRLEKLCQGVRKLWLVFSCFLFIYPKFAQILK